MAKTRAFKLHTLILGLLLMPAASFAQADFEVYDPFEPVNRKIFWFNDQADIYVLEPVATTYHDYVPNPLQKGVGNFFNNLRYPSYLVSDLVQLKFGQVASHTGRFLVNSTVGVLGVMDIAKDWGMPDHEEDFGIALAYHGVPSGPYLVIPFVGPSNVRDAFGLVVDTVLNPLYWVGYTNLSSDAKLAISAGTTALKYVDIRAGLIEGIKTAKESSVDYYLFVQGIYYQHRRALVYDGNPPEDDIILDSSNPQAKD